MYYNLWNIGKATGHYFSDCPSDQGTFKKAKWQLGSKCSSSYTTLNASIAFQILIITGDLVMVVLGQITSEGDQANTAVSLLSSCPHLKRPEITVSKDTKVYSTADDRKDRTSPRQPDGFIIRKLEEVRGVSGLLELGSLDEIEAKHAPGVVGVSPLELKRLDTFLKAGVAARRAELERAEAEKAAKSLNAEVNEATVPLS
ncbi:hypothetical protein NA56DRAFT_686977 [Hyaloscypha hepaticicola]|uniref:Uncharacterized protein n=1 Tax=Hyaloscypha hepaticicola TaxID=2082293 RepID=A0A2J6QD94_9HELO|nr:hypothetical protein NA56DRAFT_686977 [Hyaloscypha hepaticicola]